MPRKVLLHVCCGVCAYACIERLKEQGFLPTLFFFNPNIQPQAEYQKRKQAAVIVAKSLAVEIEEGDYEFADWHNAVMPYRHQREGQKRCLICYRIRLEQTFRFLLKKSYDYFTTTLTVSPYKRSLAIIEIGKDIGADKFLPFDFKKKDGFKKSIAAAKSLNLYRQNYCGCLYSLNKTKG